jgi:hypothetical protein
LKTNLGKLYAGDSKDTEDFFGAEEDDVTMMVEESDDSDDYDSDDSGLTAEEFLTRMFAKDKERAEDSSASESDVRELDDPSIPIEEAKTERFHVLGRRHQRKETEVIPMGSPPLGLNPRASPFTPAPNRSTRTKTSAARVKARKTAQERYGGAHSMFARTWNE